MTFLPWDVGRRDMAVWCRDVGGLGFENTTLGTGVSNYSRQ